MYMEVVLQQQGTIEQTRDLKTYLKKNFVWNFNDAS